MTSQTDIVLSELKRRKRGITTQDMLKFGIMRLGDCIYKLRKHGLSIETKEETCVNKCTGRKSTYARYVLNES